MLGFFYIAYYQFKLYVCLHIRFRTPVLFWLKYVWSIFGAILSFHASSYSLADSAFTGS